MTERTSWSASAGRWMGIPVRVHCLLILFVALIFAIQSNYTEKHLMGTAIVTAICLLFCILVHELAHIFALTNLGGLVNNIVLTPWGGNSEFSLPGSARGQVIVHMAGPFFNGCLFLLGVALLNHFDNHFSIWQVASPFNPVAFSSADKEESLIRIITWINFHLTIVNLIPCYPFDGGSVMRTIVNRITSQATFARREATLLVIGQATGLTMIGVAWFMRQYTHGSIQPVWFLFLTAGIALIFANRYAYNQQIGQLDELWEDSDELDYDAFYGESSFFDFEDEETDTYSQWLIEKQEERERMEREQERREESKADEILKKLHRDGIESLSEEEKGLLNRVSARLRRRRQQGV